MRLFSGRGFPNRAREDFYEYAIDHALHLAELHDLDGGTADGDTVSASTDREPNDFDAFQHDRTAYTHHNQGCRTNPDANDSANYADTAHTAERNGAQYCGSGPWNSAAGNHSTVNDAGDNRSLRSQHSTGGADAIISGFHHRFNADDAG